MAILRCGIDGLEIVGRKVQLRYAERARNEPLYRRSVKIKALCKHTFKGLG